MLGNHWGFCQYIRHTSPPLTISSILVLHSSPPLHLEARIILHPLQLEAYLHFTHLSVAVHAILWQRFNPYCLRTWVEKGGEGWRERGGAGRRRVEKGGEGWRGWCFACIALAASFHSLISLPTTQSLGISLPISHSVSKKSFFVCTCHFVAQSWSGDRCLQSAQ